MIFVGFQWSKSNKDPHDAMIKEGPDRLLIRKARTQLLTKERSGPEQLLLKNTQMFCLWR